MGTGIGGGQGPPLDAVLAPPRYVRSMSTGKPERDDQIPQHPGPSEQDQTLGASEPQDPALEKDPDEWVSGDDPMTESQKSYLDTLARRAGEELPADLTKSEASHHIDRLRRATGQDG